MQMPPLRSVTTIRRSLDLKNAALWAPNQEKTAPQDASAAPEFIKHNQSPAKPEQNVAILGSQPRTLNLKTAPQDANAAPEFCNHNWAPSKPEKNAAI